MPDVRRAIHSPGRGYRGPLIDCDVHHEWPSQAALLPYMTRSWREYVEGPGREGQVQMAASTGFTNPHGFSRADAWPPVGGRPGSDYETLCNQLLDRFDVRRAVLTYGAALAVAGVRNPYFAAEVTRAANAWTAEEWLGRDRRLAGSILVTTQLPQLAAEQIRHFGRDSRFVQVLVAGNGLGQGLGHPLYHPIYEAAVEMDLPFAIHVGGAGGANPAPAGGGALSFYIEYHTALVQPVMTHLVSLIAHGVFERFPRLRVALVEAGVAWAVPLLWRLDANYRGTRSEVPWVKRMPSEYFTEHVRLTTQPLELSPEPEQLVELVRWLGGEKLLMFATDYPHWDADDVGYVAGRLPREWHSAVYFDNAARFYRFAGIEG